ncbi:hypothetical protein BDV38DRAFT_218478 [Aspergillus pseudotamarii]|uniref:Uncharacterized protein n=1 Tax=Aspergillus pseudotamarii TaxID=132259 RepID=A0A5N6T3V4_ASPPS|nr:uncharacterized protein BDV38DRAFT_218478 [Aspergillus pseudotamarii]KAE8140986.1 hypothetical protein BDV38DRAFT_218478 [Aspergillus pseudotamarii]
MADPSSQVSWQSAFWALVPLALVTMFQPSGRVCGLHPRLRTYLRGSPFICAADSLAILFRFATYWISGRSPSLAAQMILSIRFSAIDNAEDEPSETVRDLEKLTIIRWVGFLIGSFSQALKLTAMQGIPWTRSWGYCYLTSFVVIELLNLLAHVVEDLPTAELQPGISEEIQRLLSFVERWLGYLAISAHIAFLVWAMPTCWGENLCKVEKETSRPLQALSLTVFSLSVLGAYYVPKMWLHTLGTEIHVHPSPSPGYPLFLMVLPPDFSTVKGILYETVARMLPSQSALVLPIVYTGLVMATITWGSSFVVLGWFFVIPFITRSFEAFDMAMFWLPKLMFFVLSVGGGGLLCAFGLSRFPVLRRQLFFLPPMQSSGISQPELQALGNLVIFFATLTITPLWYAWQYDPKGTVKPSWTERLG